MNSKLEVSLRKHENTLTVSGLAVVAFGLWEIVKVAIMVTLQPEYFDFIMEPLKEDPAIKELVPYAATLSVILIAIFYGIYIGLRLFIFRRANAVGRRKSDKTGFVVWAILCSISTLVSFMMNVSDMIAVMMGAVEVDIYDEGIITILLDLTSLLVMLDLVISGISVRVLRKKIKQEKEKA